MDMDMESMCCLKGDSPEERHLPGRFGNLCLCCLHDDGGRGRHLAFTEQEPLPVDVLQQEDSPRILGDRFPQTVLSCELFG